MIRILLILSSKDLKEFKFKDRPIVLDLYLMKNKEPKILN